MQYKYKSLFSLNVYAYQLYQFMFCIVVDSNMLLQNYIVVNI